MVKPDKVPGVVKALAAEAKRQGWSAYRIKQEAGIPLSTAQALLGEESNPTASTLEAVAKALGVAIQVERK